MGRTHKRKIEAEPKEITEIEIEMKMEQEVKGGIKREV